MKPKANPAVRPLTRAEMRIELASARRRIRHHRAQIKILQSLEGYWRRELKMGGAR